MSAAPISSVRASQLGPTVADSHMIVAMSPVKNVRVEVALLMGSMT